MNKPTEQHQKTYSKLVPHLNQPRVQYTNLIIECILLAFLREINKI